MQIIEMDDVTLDNKNPGIIVSATINNSKKILRYQFHLQKMVVKKEPLKYLEKFL